MTRRLRLIALGILPGIMIMLGAGYANASSPMKHRAAMAVTINCPCIVADTAQQDVVAVRHLGGSFGFSGQPVGEFTFSILGRVGIHGFLPFTGAARRFNTLEHGYNTAEVHQSGNAGGCWTVSNGQVKAEACNGRNRNQWFVFNHFWWIPVGLNNAHPHYPRAWAVFFDQNNLLLGEEFGQRANHFNQIGLSH